MYKKIVPVLLVFLACLVFSACSVIGGIFKAGMGVGIFIVVVVVIVVLLLMRRMGKK